MKGGPSSLVQVLFVPGWCDTYCGFFFPGPLFIIRTTKARLLAINHGPEPLARRQTQPRYRPAPLSVLSNPQKDANREEDRLTSSSKQSFHVPRITLPPAQVPEGQLTSVSTGTGPPRCLQHISTKDRRKDCRKDSQVTLCLRENLLVSSGNLLSCRVPPQFSSRSCGGIKSRCSTTPLELSSTMAELAAESGE